MEIPLPVPPAPTVETLRPAIAGCAKACAWRVEPAGAGWRIRFGAGAAFRPEELPFVLDIAPAENGCAAWMTFVPRLRLWALATAAVLPLACWAAYGLPWALRQEVDP